MKLRKQAVKFGQKVTKVSAVVIGGTLIGLSNAHAALDTTGWAVDISATEAIMGIVMPALLLMFGFRKAIKTANRS